MVTPVRRSKRPTLAVAFILILCAGLIVEGFVFQNVTIKSNTPMFISVYIDGQAGNLTVTKSFIVGSTHSISAPSVVNITQDTRYAFLGWSDGVTDPTRNFIIPVGGETLTAVYTKQFLLSIITNSTEGVVSSSTTLSGSPIESSWVNYGQHVNLTAAGSSYQFETMKGIETHHFVILGWQINGVDNSSVAFNNMMSIQMNSPEIIRPLFFDPVTTTQNAIISQYTCSATNGPTYVIQVDGSGVVYGFSADTCALTYGGPNNAGGISGNWDGVFGAAISNAGATVIVGQGTYIDTGVSQPTPATGTTINLEGVMVEIHSHSGTQNWMTINNVQNVTILGGVTLQGYPSAPGTYSYGILITGASAHITLQGPFSFSMSSINAMLNISGGSHDVRGSGFYGNSNGANQGFQIGEKFGSGTSITSYTHTAAYNIYLSNFRFNDMSFSLVSHTNNVTLTNGLMTADMAGAGAGITGRVNTGETVSQVTFSHINQAGADSLDFIDCVGCLAQNDISTYGAAVAFDMAGYTNNSAFINDVAGYGQSMGFFVGDAGGYSAPFSQGITLTGDIAFDNGQGGGAIANQAGFVIRYNNILTMTGSVAFDNQTVPSQNYGVVFQGGTESGSNLSPSNINLIGNNLGSNGINGTAYTAVTTGVFNFVGNSGISNSKMAHPFINNHIAPYGTASAPSASTIYTVTGAPVLLTCSGGTGVSLTVEDESSNTVGGLSSTTCASVPATGIILQVGWKVTFGAFSVAPTVVLTSTSNG